MVTLVATAGLLVPRDQVLSDVPAGRIKVPTLILKDAENQLNVP
jgi:hypothetical protein